jgi:hypothetical protein
MAITCTTCGETFKSKGSLTRHRKPPALRCATNVARRADPRRGARLRQERNRRYRAKLAGRRHVNVQAEPAVTVMNIQNILNPTPHESDTEMSEPVESDQPDYGEPEPEEPVEYDSVPPQDDTTPIQTHEQPPGTDEHELDGDIEVIEHEECGICTFPITSSVNVTTVMCGHKFHHHCLDDWVSQARTRREARCPMCRRGVFPNPFCVFCGHVIRNPDDDGVQGSFCTHFYHNGCYEIHVNEQAERGRQIRCHRCEHFL